MNPSPVPKKKPSVVVAVPSQSVPKAVAKVAAAEPTQPQPVPSSQPSQPADPTERAKERMVTKDLVNQLRRTVDRNTRRWKRLIIMEALGVAIAIPVGYFLLAILLDNLVHLSTWARLLAFLLLIGGVGFLGWWFTRRWRAVRLTEDQVALAMEKHTPGAHNRLINSLQIARDSQNQSPEFEAAIVSENFQSLKKIQVHQAMQMRPAMIRVSIALALIAMGVGLWMLKPEHFKNSTARLFQPFKKIRPLYRTTLTIKPGNAQTVPGGDVDIEISIQGDKPKELVIQRNVGGIRSSDEVPVNPNADFTAYKFKSLDRSLTYWVKGGDFNSESFAIEVPTPPQLNLVRATLRYPDYTRVPPQKIESSGGDLEALFETRAALTFVLDQPSDQAFLLIEKVAPPAAPAKAKPDAKSPAAAKADSGKTAPMPAEQPVQRIELKKDSPTEFSGEIVFSDVLTYQVEIRQDKKPPQPSPKYALRVLSDQAPQLALSGLGKQAEVQLGAVVPLKVNASDDYGLTEVALFSRKVVKAAVPIANSGAEGSASSNPPVEAPSRIEDNNWQQVAKWPVADSKKDFTTDTALMVSSLGVIEGDKVEVVLRGKDADPHKDGRWTSGESYIMVVGGEGAMFQVLYEQILQTETDLKRLISTQEQGVAKANEWIQKLDPASGMRWDDQKNLDALAKAMRAQARDQEEFHHKTGQAARDMVQIAQTSNFRLGLGMLADMEITRSVRILEVVPSKDTPQNKRATLTEARMKEEQIIRGLQEMLEQYANFRQEWELTSMTPFIKMLAERQTGLRDESVSYKDKAPAGNSAQIVQKSAHQRQAKMLHLSTLAQTALAGIGERVSKKADPIFGKAFTDASGAFEVSGLKAQMQQAGDDLAAGRWAVAEAKQAKAAETLSNIHLQLKKATVEASLRLKKSVDEAQKNALAEKKKTNELHPGGTESVMPTGDVSVLEIVHMMETIQKKKNAADGSGAGVINDKFEEWMKSIMLEKDHGQRPPIEEFKLKKKPDPSDFKMSGLEGMKAETVAIPKTPDKIDDLRGALLEESEKLTEKYESLEVNSQVIAMDTGEIGKMGGRMNSFAAVAKTGNQKPPTANVGGMSKTGRGGARAKGLVVGDTSPNMRGRDTPQEGDENVPDQEGRLKEVKTDDMQKEPSTGRGGKKVDSDKTQFSASGEGEWQDKDAKNMGKPQQVEKIVERTGGKQLDPKVAAMMRDLNSTQVQMIERVNALKKEFKNLYLPTDALDDKISQLNNNLDKLKDRPSPELFRIQQQVLDQLRREVMVFDRAVSTQPPSVPREQVVRGRIVDEPAWQTTPGYERAVKYYYEKLSVR